MQLIIYLFFFYIHLSIKQTEKFTDSYLYLLRVLTGLIDCLPTVVISQSSTGNNIGLGFGTVDGKLTIK